MIDPSANPIGAAKARRDHVADATSAAKAIQARHQDEADWMTPICHVCDKDFPCPDHADAGVVLARLSEAITHIEAIAKLEYHEPADSPGGRAYAHAVAALAALRGENAED